jgi:NAD(P)-dependent dehydrogenase (short-subunit alcohol dehydrogenase family)
MLSVMKTRLQGKNAVITGGNSGIGKAVAFALAEAGCQVVIAARRAEENKKIAGEIGEKTGASVIAVTADLSLEEDCKRLIQTAIEETGRIDILVNNAGIGGGDSVEKTDTKIFDRVMKTNLYGPFWCSREAFPHLRKNSVDAATGLRGSIINIASLAGKEAWAGQATYSCSKFGLMALTQALADEGVEHLIRTTAICPALVATPMTEVSGPDYLSPEDIAATALYLLHLSAAAWPTEIVLPRRGAS